jgi:predicted MPP superfamily phosphohydrolase
VVPPLGRLTRVAGAAVGAALAAVAWSVLVEPRRLDVREERATVPRLPRAWWGGRVALLADIHAGARFGGASVATTRRAVRRIVAQRPALALIAGDLVYEALLAPRDAIPGAVDLVRPLPAAGIPTYAVLGNHDHALETARSRRARRGVAETLARALTAAGIVVLENEAVALPAPTVRATAHQHPAGRAQPDAPAAHRREAGGSAAESPLYLAGVGDHMSGADRPREAVARVAVGAPRLVLMHDPASFPGLPAGSAPLALAGHTHGGQLRVPGLPALTIARLPPLRRTWPDYCDGWIEGYGQPGNHLYVNRGIGFSYVPARFGCTPELTVFTLLPGPGGAAPSGGTGR